jgi:acyl-CoA thioester hydrolase
MVPTDFRYVLPIPTRWIDNDIYGHVNNVVYYAYFDTVINRWLIDEGGLDIAKADVIGVCVESKCQYVQSASFPEELQAGLRVAKVGTTSVTYEVAIFRGSELCASGLFVHVFVDRATRTKRPIPTAIRAAVTRLA